MGSLIDQTEAALARVLSLCGSGPVGDQDVDALQRHDEAALALLDINDDDAMKVGRIGKRCGANKRNVRETEGGCPPKICEGVGVFQSPAGEGQMATTCNLPKLIAPQRIGLDGRSRWVSGPDRSSKRNSAMGTARSLSKT